MTFSSKKYEETSADEKAFNRGRHRRVKLVEQSRDLFWASRIHCRGGWYQPRDSWYLLLDEAFLIF